MMIKIKNRSGMAPLAELLIVIGIISLVSLISWPQLRKYQPNLKLSGEAKNLASDLRYAQQLTITEQVPYRINLDLFNNQYQLIKTGSATTTIKSVTLDKEISFNASTTLNYVEFNSYGAVTASSTGDIYLSNTNGTTAIINIKPAGYIQISSF